MERRRQSIRVKNFDYTSNMAYFVTLCTWQREMTLGSVNGNRMTLSALGEIARDLWLEIPEHHPHVETDELIVMPDHLHGILTFVRRGLPWQTPTAQRDATFGHRVPGSLGSVVGMFKSAVTRKARVLFENAELLVWQKNYFERVIRNDTELNAVREYIAANPATWSRDLTLETPWAVIA